MMPMVCVRSNRTKYRPIKAKSIPLFFCANSILSLKIEHKETKKYWRNLGDAVIQVEKGHKIIKNGDRNSLPLPKCTFKAFGRLILNNALILSSSENLVVELSVYLWSMLSDANFPGHATFIFPGVYWLLHWRHFIVVHLNYGIGDLILMYFKRC